MRTVRLPIYDDGVLEVGKYLEIDVPYFIPPTVGLRSSRARIVEEEPFQPDPIEEPLADWERALLDNRWDDVSNDEVGLTDTSSDHPSLVDDWRPLEGVPTQFFEINGFGAIRHRGTGAIMKEQMHPEKLVPAVKLIINRQDWWIEGPALAAKMWSKR
jgi:hypothetical protein